MSVAARAETRFTEREMKFAFAWEVHAPGLGGWSVAHDTDEEGRDVLLVDPPLVAGDGFLIRRETSGVVVTSPLGTQHVASLREALLLICPIWGERLVALEALAALDGPLI